MRKRSVSVEWHVAESEEEWRALHQERERAIQRSTRKSFLRWSASVLLMVTIALGVWQWQQQQETALDSSPDSTVDEHTSDGALAENVGASQQFAIADRGGLFTNDVVRMLEHPEKGIHTFQHVDPALRPVLANALWGAQQALDTSHFHFQYRQIDAKTVTAGAPQIEQIYLELWQSWDLPLTATPFVVQVSELYVRTDLPYVPQQVDQLTVSSPALYPTVAPWTTTDLFVQSVVLLLVDQLLAEAVEHYAIGAARDPMLNGLRLWQLWDLRLPLAEQKTVLVPWLFTDLTTWQAGTPLPVPENYERLCTIYLLWMNRPSQLQIPLLCAEQDQSPLRFAPEVLQRPPVVLPWLNVKHYLDEEADGQLRVRDGRHPGEVVALTMLVDYLVTTHGRAKLPDLLANLNRYRTWDDLLPAVYGVTKSEVEADWRQVLQP